MKSLSETFVYKHFNSKVNIQQSLANLLTKGQTLTEEDLIDNLSVIRKNFNFVGKNKVLTTFDNGLIKPVFNHDTSDRLTEAIPCFLLQKDGAITAIMNLTNIATFGKKDGFYRMDNRKLYAYLNTSYLSLKMHQDNLNSLKFKTNIVDTTARLYAHLFMRILNKAYRLNTDRQEHDKALAMIYKFCCINLIGVKDSDSLSNYAKNATSLTKDYLSITEKEFRDDDFKDINSFIGKLSTSIRGLKELTTVNFIENYIRMYGISSVFALEYLPLFYHMIFAVSIGAFINNQYSIEAVIEKEVDKLFANIISIY